MSRCTECGEECEIKEIDNGIGCHEFHGAKGSQVNMVEVSDCCKAPVVDEEEYQADLESKFDDKLENLIYKYTDKGLRNAAVSAQLENQYFDYRGKAEEEE